MLLQARRGSAPRRVEVPPGTVVAKALTSSAGHSPYRRDSSPRPRLSFGLALSTGYESLGEYLDIDLADEVDPALLPTLVNPSLPPGLEAQVAVTIPPGTDSLQQAVTSSGWQIDLPDVSANALAAAVDRVLALDELPITVERKGTPTTLDARPAILSLLPSGSVLDAELATQPRSLRPAELLRAVDPGWVPGRVLRTHQWTSVDGARCEPIPFGDLGARGATSAPHAEARAS